MTYSDASKFVDMVAQTYKYDIKTQKSIPADNILIDPTDRIISIGDFRFNYSYTCVEEMWHHCMIYYAKYLGAKEVKDKVKSTLES